MLDDLGVWLDDITERITEDAQIAQEWRGFLMRLRTDEMWQQWAGADLHLDSDIANEERVAASISLLDHDDVE